MHTPIFTVQGCLSGTKGCSTTSGKGYKDMHLDTLVPELEKKDITVTIVKYMYFLCYHMTVTFKIYTKAT